MIYQPTLALSILKPDAVPDRGGLIRMPPSSGMLTLTRGEFAGRTYRVRLDACGNPTCACCGVRIVCEPAGVAEPGSAERAALTFWLDVWDKEVIESDQLTTHADCRRLATAVQSELTDDDWHDLFFWFRLVKSEIIAETDVEEFNTDTLPEATGGRMVGVVDVFPWGSTLEFALGDEFWAVDEQYCVQADCKCHESILTFLKYQNRDAKKIIGPRNPPSLRYDYRSETIQKTLVWPQHVPTSQEMMEALKKSEPALSTGMKLRHTLLQVLYGQRDIKKISRQIASIRPPKVGRNDPCPCGSGKKFKHCCLGKKGPAATSST